MSSSKIVVGFLAGAAVGALAGILFAPDKGSSTRKKIVSKTGDLTDSVKNSFSDFIDGVKETYAGAEDKLEKFADKAKSGMVNAKNDMKNAVS
jgi:gas vesicle protein